jgi:hypothetical protein
MPQRRCVLGTEEIRRAADSFVRRGWALVPVPHAGKRPITAGWPQLRLSKSDLPRRFGRILQDIGQLLGQPSRGLVDIDLDSKEAITLAPVFLPDPECIFGHHSKEQSHWLCAVSPVALAGTLLRFNGQQGHAGAGAILHESPDRRELNSTTSQRSRSRRTAWPSAQ